MSKIKKSELLDIVREQGSAITNLLQRVTLLEKPQLKQLDQSVFNNMHERWKFAAVDKNGSAHRFNKEVFPYRGGFCYEGEDCNELKFSLIGKGYDASNWQNSLIERDIAKELTGSDLCRAMIIGDRDWVLAYVSNENDATALFHENAMVVTDFDLSEDAFYCRGENWAYAVPINNQGEPLTAAEVGL